MKEILTWLLPFLFQEKPIQIYFTDVVKVEILNDFDIQNGFKCEKKRIPEF